MGEKRRVYSREFKKNIILIAFSFFLRFSFYSPFVGLYLKGSFNSTSHDILVMFSVYAFALFIFEIPMGVISDRFGEKISLIAGSILQTLSTVLMIAGSYTLFLIGEVVFALAQSLFSGSYESMLFKHCRKASNPLDYEKVLGHTTSMLWLSISLCSLLGYFLARINIDYVFYASIVGNLVCLFLSGWLPIVEKTKRRARSPIIMPAFRHIREHSVYTFWMFRAAVYMATITSGYLLIQAFLNEQGLSGPTNGLLYFSITLFAYISSVLYPKIKRLPVAKTTERVLIFLIALISLTFLSLSQAKTLYLVVVFACIFRLTWGFSTPFFISILNREIKNDHVRNSLLSINSLLTNLLGSLLMLVLSRLNSSSGYFFLVIILLLLVASIILMPKPSVNSYEKG